MLSRPPRAAVALTGDCRRAPIPLPLSDLVLSLNHAGHWPPAATPQAPSFLSAPRDVTNYSPGRARHGAFPRAAVLWSWRAAAAVSIPAQNQTSRSTVRAEERAPAHKPFARALQSGSCRPRPSVCFAAALSSQHRFGTESKIQYKSRNTPPIFRMTNLKITVIKGVSDKSFSWHLKKEKPMGTESAEANLLAVKKARSQLIYLGSSTLTAPSVLWCVSKEVSSSAQRRSPFSVEDPMTVPGTGLKNRSRLLGGYLKWSAVCH